MEPRPLLKLSLSAAATADHGRAPAARPPSIKPRRERLTGICRLPEGLEEAPSGAALVLVDRALVVRRGQGHAHRRRHDARLDAGLAQPHAVVDGVEICNA